MAKARRTSPLRPSPLGPALRLAIAAALAAPIAACANPATTESTPPGADAGTDSTTRADASPPADDASKTDDATLPGDDDDDDDASPPAPDAGPITDADLITKLLALTKPCSGASIVSAHTYQGNNGKPVDICKSSAGNALYYTAKMAIDCDGKTTTHCPGTGADKDCCYFNDTSFHNLQGEPLSAELDPYVVIPLDFNYPGLDQDQGGNIIAVIYKNQLEFAVFGDQGPTDLIGESSFKTAATLGINSSPASGGVDGDVTYIVFVGSGTQPHDIESQTEIQTLGKKLATALVSGH